MKTSWKLLLGSAAVFALAACGSDSGEDEAPASLSETQTETATEAAAPEPTITPNAEPLASTHPNSIQPETTLQISADASVNREPDVAFIMAGVTSEAETAQQAMADNRAAMNSVFAVLEDAGIDTRDMQTSNFSLNPRYDYSNRRNGEPARLVGYTASNQLSVRVRDLNDLGETMDALVEAGGNTFSGLRFGLDDDGAAKNEARRLAMAEAITRAELYASVAGYEVARIVTLSESGGYQPQPMMMARAEMAMDAATPIASGEVSYSMTVNVTFELRKPDE
ncbi:MAG: SIMPL domain-containing protein [Pseudomonadota bacterium]